LVEQKYFKPNLILVAARLPFIAAAAVGAAAGLLVVVGQLAIKIIATANKFNSYSSELFTEYLIVWANSEVDLSPITVATIAQFSSLLALFFVLLSLRGVC